MNGMKTRLKFVTRFDYGEALPVDEPQYGPVAVFGSNGAFASFSRFNTAAPVIVVGRKGSYGKVNWNDEPVFASDTTFVVDERTTIHNLRWLYWVLQSVNLDEGSGEAAVPGLNREDAYQREIILPPSNEQVCIAAYLDRETAAIDTLIAAKQRLRDLLAEKRRAVVAEAVMHGLNPAAPLRPSGIEWLGDIPAHWEAFDLKWVIARISSGVSVNATDQQASGDEPGVLKTSAAIGGRFFPAENKAVWETEYERLACPVMAESIIVSRMNTPALVAESGYVETDYPNLFLPDRLWQIELDKGRAEPRFIAQVLSSSIVRSSLSEMATGTSASMKNLSQEDLLNFSIPLPPISEQHEIVGHIVANTTKIDLLSEATERTITLLKERRGALISAAVTGQIDIPEAA
jgi:type I restriction enzyme S subunit